MNTNVLYKNFDNMFSYLKTLDCVLNNQNMLNQELKKFNQSKTRSIGGFYFKACTKVQIKNQSIQMLYLLSGTAKIKLNNTLLSSASDRKLYFFNSHTVVSVQTLSPNCEFILIVFKPDYFLSSHFLTQLQFNKLHIFLDNNIRLYPNLSQFLVLQLQRNSTVKVLILLLLRQIVKMRYKNTSLTYAACLLLFTELDECTLPNKNITSNNLLPSNLTKEILEYCQVHLSDFSLYSTAQHFHFNPNYLSQLISSQTGKTLIQHVNIFRIKVAKEKLITTNLTISELVSLLGYKDQSYFFKIFKQKTGLTPKQFRKKYQPK